MRSVSASASATGRCVPLVEASIAIMNTKGFRMIEMIAPAMIRSRPGLAAVSQDQRPALRG